MATAEPAEVGLDATRLRDAAENVALSPDVASLLVLRHGRLAFERYFNGRGPGSADNVHSLSKSILSLLTGIAVADGVLRLDSTIAEFLPEDLVGGHGDLTVRQLLTMAAGVESDDAAPYEWEPSVEPGEPSFLEAALSRPSVAEPDQEFAYNTGLTQVLSAVLTEATGESLCAFAADRLFGPLGIDVEHWGMDLDGYFAGGHSLFLTPREVARIGQLVLDHGDWDGESLVPSAWLDESLAQVWDLGCPSLQPVREGYGYLWWLEDVAGHRVWRASGSHGQELLGVPDLDLVVVLTHDSSGSDPGGVVGPLALLEQYVLPAVDDTPPVTEGPDCPSPALDGHTVAPDGSGRAAVAHWPSGALAGGWSPDGERLVGVLDRDLNREIYTFAPDGSSPERLTRDFAHDLMPAWTPDGTRIAFSRGEPADGDLYSVGSHGGGLRRLTHLDGFEQSPTWSPDGEQIAFVRGHGDVREWAADGALWVMGADGSRPRRLADQAVAYPSWSPNGNQIALELRGQESHIGVLALDDRTVTDLGPGAVPSWSPDGRRLAFIAARGGHWDVYVMDADGTDRVALTHDAGFDTFPLWSPDSSRILFHARRPASTPPAADPFR